jgi:diacylglycerol O-acyltransferase / wax synthase
MADVGRRSGDDMAAVDYLMYRSEDNPQFRSSITAVYVLDRAPDWDRLNRLHERTSRLFPRMRQRVVAPALPITTPCWVVDPDFDLSFHLRRVRTPAPGTLRQLLDLTATVIMAPLDRARPLWEATLVEGLENGRAALIQKFNHAVTDGLGGVQVLALMFDQERDAPEPPMPPMPVPADVTPEDLTRAALSRLPQSLVSGVRDGAGRLLRGASQSLREPRATVSEAVAFTQSLRRMIGPPPAQPSPLLRRRSLSRRLEAIEFPLASLRGAAKAAGASVNDAYLAAIGGALGHYHEELGVPVDAVPAAIPISLRSDDDPIGGNKWAGARVPIPTDASDPVVRMQEIHEVVLTARAEPAIDAMAFFAPVLSRSPTGLLNELSAMALHNDLQVSNVPGPPFPLYVAGAEIQRLYPFGPLPGPAMMITMYSQAGQCFVGINYDPAAVTHDTLFRESLRAGFDEVMGAGTTTFDARPAANG